jgi:non-homologous end joining protein Ku
MLNIYSTASSIERDWRNKNAEINKIFDDKSFDLNPKEFEEKCNKVLQDLISADSNLSIAKLLGINEDKIHQYIAENFNPSN